MPERLKGTVRSCKARQVVGKTIHLVLWYWIFSTQHDHFVYFHYIVPVGTRYMSPTLTPVAFVIPTTLKEKECKGCDEVVGAK